ncbi:MAG: MoxR family ATPase [Dysgonamonadaceae bacterium]|jgi:MoxR-like ATPase|nr:MoxR family ATPase [Dysgonamonadaceae bacterium]
MEQEKDLDKDIRFESRIDLSELQQKMDAVRQELKKVIVGQDKLINHLLVALLANGHVLLEGVPGIAKTLVVKLLAKTIDTTFSRVQFTPDLMPSDILGTSVFNLKTSNFEFRKGPIFANLILVDEVNRAPAKTQAAMFEVMEERQATIDGKTYPMEKPFIVFATQNPIEQEGTYRLPEAQLDRFLFKVVIDYPGLAEEFEIIRREHETKGFNKTADVNKVVSGEKIEQYQLLVREITVESNLMAYIANIVQHTRETPFLYLGASPRASIAILNAAKGFAALNGRDFVTPEDIKESAIPVLRHRVIVSPEKEMEGLKAEQIIAEIIANIEIPR